MQDDKPSSIFQKFFEELKLGNPIIILVVLTVLLLLGMVWVWQAISTPVVLTPNIHHPTSAARIETLTALAPHPTPTATQAAFVPSRVVVATPRAESFARHLPGPLAFLAGAFYQPRIFSR